jgi:uncharacterized protein YdhG (YjbR/CyaY superfamily)
MISDHNTVQDYLFSLEIDQQQIITSIISLLKDEFPGLQESMNLKMPTYEYKGHAVFASNVQPSYTALFVYPHHLLTPFDSEVKKYRTGKSCLKIKKLNDATEDLLVRIIRHLKAEL